METINHVLDFLTLHWLWTSLALYVLANIANALSEHYSTKKALRSRIFFGVAEVLSVVRSAGAPGNSLAAAAAKYGPGLKALLLGALSRLKLPVQSVPPSGDASPPSAPLAVALLLTLAVAGACATAGSAGQLDVMKRIDKAQKGIDAVAALAVPGFRIALKRAAEDCIAKGITDPSGCPVFLRLSQARDAVVAGIKAAYLATQKAVTYAAVGRPGDAAAAISIAEKGLSDAIDVLHRSGIMTVIDEAL